MFKIVITFFTTRILDENIDFFFQFSFVHSHIDFDRRINHK